MKGAAADTGTDTSMKLNLISLYGSARETRLTVATSLLLAGWFVSVYFVRADRAYIAATAALFTLHSVSLWIYSIVQMIHPAREWTPNLWRGVALTLALVAQYTFLYTTVLVFEPTAFQGISPSAGPSTRFFLSMFVSTETATALGSGTIFAREGSSLWPYLLIALDSVQGAILLAVIFAKLVEATRRRFRKPAAAAKHRLAASRVTLLPL